MLKKTVLDGLNDQIQCELNSAYVYLAMSAHLDGRGLSGCAHWMKMQADEELKHGMRLYEYVLDRGGDVLLKSIEQPRHEYGSPREVFETALKHERYVTGRINELYALAMREEDYATQTHLHWFIDEQVEEEKSASELVDLFTRAGDSDPAVLMLDRRLAARTAEH